MTFAFLRKTTAFIVALIGAALLGGTAPASGASITYSDPACASFAITGSNGNFTLACSGQTGGGASGAPTGCSIAPNPPSLAAAGLVGLTASCTGGAPATSYHWTASPSAAGLTADTSAATNSATISATTAFTVVASNAQGASGQATTSVQVGGGGGVVGGISCAAQGFSKTMVYTWDWANAAGGGLKVDTYNDPQGPIGPNGIVVVAFTPTPAQVGSAGTVLIAPYGTGVYQSTTRTTTISTTPCTLDAPYPWEHVGSDAGTAFTVGVLQHPALPGIGRRNDVLHQHREPRRGWRVDLLRLRIGLRHPRSVEQAGAVSAGGTDAPLI